MKLLTTKVGPSTFRVVNAATQENFIITAKTARLAKNQVMERIANRGENTRKWMGLATRGELAELITAALNADRDNAYGGMIPIPLIRDRLRHWSREDFDRVLVDAEIQDLLGLKTANDPKLASRPNDGIILPIVGEPSLYYFVVIR